MEKTIDIPQKTIDRFIHAEKEWSAMLQFIRENNNNCGDLSKEAPKYLVKRYGLSYEFRSVGLAWYLLDEYFKGNVTIKKDALTK